MPDERNYDPRSVWKSQQVEVPDVNMELLINRRTHELRGRTRTDIIGSIAAALFFGVVTATRIPAENTTFQIFGLVLIAAWSLVTLYRFRNLLIGQGKSVSDGLAVPAAVHYRRELQHRRDHLRDGWIWCGPMVLALLYFLATIGPKLIGRGVSVWNAAPFLILLAVWAVLMIRQRGRQAGELQQEIDELNRT